MKHELTRLCEQVRAARKAGTTLCVQGGNTKWFYGEPGRAAPDVARDDAIQVLDMTRYVGIINYEPSELVITARAGTLLSDIEQSIAEQGQMLAFEPPRFGSQSTIGGCVASGLSGPRRMAAGRVGDFVLGARLLDSTGTLLSFGGEVMKNVAGYDVSRLLAGSMGSLGPMVEVSLKVLPRPPCEQTQLLEVDERRALALLDEWRTMPLPISGSTWLTDQGRAQGGNGLLYIRLSGSEPAVRSAAAQIGGQVVDAAQAHAFWDSIRDQTHAFFEQRPLWRFSVPPTTEALGLGPTLIEWNGGLRWASPEMPASELRAAVAAHGGHATLYRHDAKLAGVPVFHPMPPAIERINRRLMEQLDPAGIFNPGRLLPVTQG